MLVDVDLTGLLLGATLATKPEEIYRALIEATAYGTRVIIETFDEQRRARQRARGHAAACPRSNKLLMQIYADVTGLPIRVSASKQTPALGSAMFGAVAAGARRRLRHDLRRGAEMARLKDNAYNPTRSTGRSTTTCMPSISACTTTSDGAPTT